MSVYESVDPVAVPADVREQVERRLAAFARDSGIAARAVYRHLVSGPVGHGDVTIDTDRLLNAWTDGQTITLVLYRGRPLTEDLDRTLRHELVHVVENVTGVGADFIDERSGVACSRAAQSVASRPATATATRTAPAPAPVAKGARAPAATDGPVGRLGERHPRWPNFRRVLGTSIFRDETYHQALLARRRDRGSGR